MGNMSRLPSGPSAPPLQIAVPDRCCAEVVALGGKTAVRGAIEIRLRPIPRRVASDGPPRRSGDAHADAKDKSNERGSEDADPVFAIVESVNESESGRRGPGGLPESRVRCFVQVEPQAGEQPEERDDVDTPGAAASGR